jgi:peptidoglycan/LPS O-acetylase OafA/YrhL
MRDVAFVFFLAAVLCVSVGMAWGIQMAISQDHLMSGAHAHLNLVGWLTMALFGIYYRLTPHAASNWLARVHAGIAILGVLVMVPGIAIAITSGQPSLAAVGALLTALSMAIFLLTVLRHGFGPRSPRKE